MATKEQEFKQRFIEVMKNLHSDGRRDAEAMWLMGSLAARLVDKSRQTSWTQFKSTRTKRGYDRLLQDFSTEGNAYHNQGRTKHAYAVQLLAMSMVARYQRDPDVQAGLQLLDEVIDSSIVSFRKSKTRPSLS